jgi:nicotinate-nucleotide adenylyltransferase
MGADSFFGLRRWHRASELPFVAPVIVASRPGQPLPDLEADLKTALPPGLALEPTPQEAQKVSQSESGIEVRTFILVNPAGDRAPLYVLPGLHVEISASEIRARIHAASGNPAAERDLVPQAVRDYIAQQGLYCS